ncbi:transposase [Oxyplasma meridianum]|uniref:Transposase n=1 Tax=Oxyplasma meridianum TaxID=3073602 RepID=A0AAX4NF24_9ARCH
MRKIKTTNVLKRMNCGMNSELKRIKEKVKAFPSEQSLLRLVVSIMIDKQGVDHWKKVFEHGG